MMRGVRRTGGVFPPQACVAVAACFVALVPFREAAVAAVAVTRPTVGAWATLLPRNGDLQSILRALSILAAFAVALLVLTSLALRRRRTDGAP
ncbi:hypothetical protein [Streptomyces pseudovenezuelae]|uniref:hypothetical protein n=1 Tax=Streptomyces pseudovenezuelae TaxID=67350 RepID=UPI0036E90A2A